MKQKLYFLCTLFWCTILSFGQTPATHLNFDGVNDYVAINPAAINNLTSGTIETWVYLNSLNQQTVCSKQSNGEASYAIFAVGGGSSDQGAPIPGQVSYQSSNGSIIKSTGPLLQTGQWYHLAISFTNTQARLYVNGVLNNTVNANFSLVNDLTVTATSIGAWLGDGGGQYFNGNIDEFRIWNVVRTAAQIDGSRNCELAGTETGLVTYYKFNQGNDATNNTAITTTTATTGSDGILTNFALNGTISNFLAGSPVSTSTAPSAMTQSFCGLTNVNMLSPGISQTINWYDSATATNPLNSSDNVTTGTYYVAAVNANGCESLRTSVSVTVSIMEASILPTNILCNGGANGSLTVMLTGGISPYSYSWLPNVGTGATISGLPTGTYCCTITDASGCSVTYCYDLHQPDAITASTSQTNVSCNGGSNGTATVTPSGGVGGYTYLWTPSGGTDATATGLSAGTYSCTVTDANNCQVTRDIFVLERPLLTTSASQTNVSCNGGYNGTATVTPSGGTPPYNYSWSPSGGTSATATGLSEGTYTCTITDYFNCSITSTVTINEPNSPINTTTSQTNVSCNGGYNGTATVTPSGGTPPYNYSWSPSGGTSATATGLTAGSYTATVTDANSCQATRTFTITQPTAINTTTGSQTNVSCNGGSNGSATVTPSGGAGGYTYSWAPSGGTAATASGLSAGSYTVTVTDANSCQATQTFTITQPTAIDNTVAVLSGVITANQSSASYQWYQCPNNLLTGATSQSYTPTVNGDYKVEITIGSCVVSSVCETVLGNRSFETNIGLSVYPNPSTGIFNIALQEDANITVNDMLGKVIYTNKVKAGNNTIDISNYQSGIYLLSVTTENGSVTKKLIKE